MSRLSTLVILVTIGIKLVISHSNGLLITNQIPALYPILVYTQDVSRHRGIDHVQSFTLYVQNLTSQKAFISLSRDKPAIDIL